MRMRSPLGSSGFTLIEVIIAMLIFAILATMSYSGLHSVINSKEKTEASLERLEELQLAMLTLTSDLQQLSTRNGHDSLGGKLLYLTTQDSEHIIDFTRSGWNNPSNQMRSTLQRVAYKIDDDTLIRIHWSHVDRANDEKVVERTLISNIENLEIRFLNESNVWLADWPPANVLTNDRTNNMPLAIELTLKMNDWGEIKRLIKVNQ